MRKGKKKRKALGFLLLGRYIPHCGLFHGITLRQQIQRTLSTDRAARKVLMREEKKKKCAWACLLAGQLLVHSQSADTV